ncbi:Ig-like domain-containing protein [Sanguibacter suaedae]|uniref:Tandem-95 repeat protein n=1 Tax=Sanguibacter suaedae TaxID=2795737 RepID=A0A934IDL5_9MICO|nr:Ig-like domain-containing protein [Sanguibacter suaedae]MBI9115896.1 tandem-95 repeat protein [Sanguibacter suaedae]
MLPITDDRSPRTATRTTPPTARRIAVALVLALLGLQLTAVGLAAPADAAVIRQFDPVFSANTNGDVMLVGNTLMTCVDSADCTTSRNVVNGPAGSNSNNNFTSRYVDVDGVAGTFNSSSADLDLPSGSAVLFAAIVWGGRLGATSTTNADAALRGQARMTVENGTGSQVHDLVASRVDSTGNNYASYLDITDIVADAGDATYTVANVQAAVGGNDQYAGWSLVLAVADPSAPARNLTIFNGYGSVAGGDTVPTTFAVDGFLTPPSGPVRTTLGVMTFEGDMGLQGDALLLNGTTISDTRNPANNPFNSTVTDRGVPVTTRNPAYANQLGIDVDLFSADAVLGNNATSAAIELRTSGDAYLPSLVTFATDLYDPKLLGTKTVTDLDGGSVLPGDVLEYRVPVENIGLDTSSLSRFFDAIPTGTTYVPGSIELDATPQTDAHDGDTTRFVADGNGHIEVFLGDGATPERGGEIPMSTGAAQHVVTFRVTVDADATNAQELINAAVLTYRGQTTFASAASATNAVLSPVVTDPIAGNAPPEATPHLVSFAPAPGARTLVLDVLADDTDPDGDLLTVVGVTDAAGGTVSVGPDGTVTYAPRENFAGRDVFTYTIQDTAGNRATAAVQVEVVNTAPDAVDDSTSVPGATPAVLDLVANDSDPNGDALTVRSADLMSAEGGTVTVTDGVATYTPAPGFRGTDTFTYTVEDSRGASDVATVTVTVTNNAPVAVDDTVSGNIGVAIPVDVRANDSDLDEDALAVSVLTGPSHGTLTLAADGTGTYRPNPGYSGPDSFTYRVSDGFGGTDDATVTISVNGSPVAVDDARSTPGDTPVSVAVLDNDSDPEGDPLTVTATSVPSHGAAAAQLDGTVVYTPDPGWAGDDTFTYTVSDAGGLQATATVTVTTANAQPVARPDAVSTAAGTPATDVDVLSNDSDANVTAGVPGQALAVSGATADHGAAVTVGDAGTLTVTPAPGYRGIVTVTYTLTDGAGGTATGTLTVTVDNGAPSALSDGPVTTQTSTPVVVDVLANDTDPNPADTLVVVPGSLTAPVDRDGAPRGTVELVDGRIRYTPPTGWAGTATFAYDVSDGNGGTATGTVTVVVVNAAPSAVDDAVTTPSGTATTVDVLANDSDANIPGSGQSLRVTATSADEGARVVVRPDGRLTVTPAAGFEGVVTVLYTVGDGAGGSATATLLVTVRNAVPVAAPDTASTAYLQPVDVDLLANDTDPNPGDRLSVKRGSATRPTDAAGTPRGSVTLSGGVATYSPPAGFSGEVTFRYTVTDGTDEHTATVTVTVGNAAPVLAPGARTTRATTTNGSTVVIDVLAGISDPDGGTLRLVQVAQPASGTVRIVDDVLVYSPAPGYTGTVSFTYTVDDGQGGTLTGTVTVEVVSAPASPDVRSGEPLARTGAQVVGLAATAVLLLGAGAALVRVTGRSRAS